MKLKVLAATMALAVLIAAPVTRGADPPIFDFNGYAIVPTTVGGILTMRSVLTNNGVIPTPIPLDFVNNQYTLVVTGTSLISSRGCPQACTFCDRSVFGNRYRYFSEDYLWELISSLRRQYGIRHLVFTDDQFAAFRPRLVRLCEKMASGNPEIRWNCDARVDSVDPDLLRLMKRAGCWMISYGIESGSQKILDRIRKGITLEQVEQAVRSTKEAGIRAKGLFMIGYPEETEETLGQTLDFIRRSRLDEMNLSFLTPYPGREIYQEVRGSKDFVEDWERMNALNCLLRPRALSCPELEKAYGK